MCHTLDLQLLYLTVDGPTTTSISFEKCQAAVEEVNQLEVKLRHEKEKIYLEQVLTALVLTTEINNQQAAINTGIPALLADIANNISHIVSINLKSIQKYSV